MSLIVVTFSSSSGWDQAARAKRARMSVNDNGSLACSEALKLLAGAQHWILDIDLDFFSTANPFCSSLSKVCTLFTVSLSLCCFKWIGTSETSQRLVPL